MDTQQERLYRLNHALLSGKDVCSSEGMLHDFPESLKKPFQVNGVGVVVCRQGSFMFTLNQKDFSAKANETLFIPGGSVFQVCRQSEDAEVFILVYQTEPIRDIIGNCVTSMHLYSQLATEPCYVWSTGEENEVLKYMSLLDNTLQIGENTFNNYEQKLLLLGLTYRLCSIYNRKLITQRASVGHKHDIFIRLIQLIEKYYMEQRGVEFYADKLCITPNYLNEIVTSIMGLSAKQYIQNKVMDESKRLLAYTDSSISDIAFELHFSTVSYFIRCFRQHTGETPLLYRKTHKP